MIYPKILPLLICISVLAVSCRKEIAPAKKTIKVRVTTATKMCFFKKISVRGNIEPRQFAEICAKTDGAIELLPIDEGDRVREGQVLFRLERRDWESKVEIEKYNLQLAKRYVKEQEANLTISEARLAKWTIDLKRCKKLHEGNLTSQDHLENTELSWRIAHLEKELKRAHLQSSQAKVAQAHSNLVIAQKYLRDCTMLAPFSGTITARYKETGEYATKSSRILRIENPRRLEMCFLLSSQYYNAIVSGKTAAVIHNNGKRLDTTVSYKAPCIDAQSRTFEIKIYIDNHDDFVSGMMCTTDIILQKRIGYGVPKEAVLLHRDDRHIIFSPHGEVARAIEVKVGLTNNGYTELINIPNPKSLQIIVQGQSFLNDGSKIEVIIGNQSVSQAQEKRSHVFN